MARDRRTEGKWVLNPDCGIFTVSSGQALALVSVATSGAELLLETHVELALLQFVSSPRARGQMATFLRGEGMTASVARDLLTSLTEAEVIVSAPLAHNGAMWRAYGWDEARYLQKWSEDQAFIDDGDLHHAVRRRTLESYASDAGAPKPRPAATGAIRLPSSKLRYEGDLFDLLRERRTTRSFSGDCASLAVLSTVLQSALAEPRNAHLALHDGLAADPLPLLRSRFGAFDLFVVSQRVSGLDPGVYEYFPVEHALELRTLCGSSVKADADLKALVWGQAMPQRAAFSILVTIDFARHMWRYRYPRAFRNLLISVGELGQLLLLCGQALGLKSCMTPAIQDSFADALLGLNSNDRQVYYYLGFGK